MGFYFRVSGCSRVRISGFQGRAGFCRQRGAENTRKPGRTRPLHFSSKFSSKLQEMGTATRSLEIAFCQGAGAHLRPGARSLRWSTPGLSLASDLSQLNVLYSRLYRFWVRGNVDSRKVFNTPRQEFYIATCMRTRETINIATKQQEQEQQQHQRQKQQKQQHES